MIRGTSVGGPGRPNGATRAAELIRLAAHDPVELYDRVRARLEVTQRKRRPAQPIYSPTTWDTFAGRLEGVAGDDVPPRLYTDEFERVYQGLAAHASSLPPAPFPAIFDADPLLARLAYTLTRVLRPEVVVETGVALGVVTACILSALEQNGRGRLISVDLPPLGVSAESVGLIVPDALRSRWSWHRGSSTRLLPQVLAGLPPVGLFLQDSLFTWRNSTREFSQVLPHLAGTSAIIANCVQHSHAFSWLVDGTSPSVHAVLAAEEKPRELVGVWISRADSPAVPLLK
jgi:hypothetical protein